MNVTPSVTVPDSTGKVVTLSVPEVVATAEEQSVVYSVSYKGEVAVAAPAFVIDAVVAETIAPVIAATASVNVTAAAQAYTFTVADEVDGSGIDASSIEVKQGTATLVATAVADQANTYQVSLNKVDGDNQILTINASDVAGNKATTASVTLVDKVAPTIVNVKALDATTIEVTFMEDMNIATVEDVTNYSLYSLSASKLVALDPGTAASGTAIHATAAQVPLDAKKVLINITAHAAETGYVLGGFANADYILYVNDGTVSAAINIAADKAANIVAKNSNVQFTGTSTASSVGPKAKSATFDKTAYNMSITFDKVLDASDTNIDEAKIQITDGTTTVALTEANYTSSATDVISFGNFTTDQKVAIDKLDESKVTFVLAAGSVQDAAMNNNSVAGDITPTLTVRPELKTAAYDDVTNRLTLKFSQAVNVGTLNGALGSLAFESTAGTFTPLTSTDSLLTLTNSDTVVVKLNQTDARAIEAVTLEKPDFRLTLNNTQNGEVITGIKNTVTSPVNAVEKDYADALTINKTALAITKTEYDEATHTIKVTFNKDVKYDANDSLKATVYVNGVSVGVVGSAAGTSLKDAPTELADAKTLTFDVAAADTDGTADVAIQSEIETAPVKAGTQKVQISLAAGSVTDQSGIATFEVLPANKLDVTYKVSAETITAAPTISTDGSGYVVVTFDQKVTEATAENVANYVGYLAADTTTMFVFESAELLADGTTVYLKSNTPLTLTSTDAYKLGVKNVTSLNGEVKIVSTVLADAGTPTSFTATALTGPALTGSVVTLLDGGLAGLSAGDTLTLKFDRAVNVDATKFSGASANEFTLGGGTTTLGSDAKIAQGTNSNEVIVTLGTGHDVVVGTTTIAVDATNNDSIFAVDGTTKAIVGTTVTINAPSTSAPTVKDAMYTDANTDGILNVGDEVKVTFTDKVALATGKTLSDLTNDFVFSTVGVADYTVTLADDGLSATLKLATVTTALVPGTTTVNLTGSSDLVGLWSNVATPATTAVKVEKSETLQPSVLSATYNVTVAGTKQIVLQLSEKVNVVADNTFGENFSVVDSSGTIATTNAVALDADDASKVIITLSDSADFVQAGTTTIKVAPLSTIGIKDANGNIMKFTNTTIVVQ